MDPSVQFYPCRRKTASFLPSFHTSYSIGLWAFGLLYLLLSSMASAAPVTLAWDPVSDSNLAGYKLTMATPVGNTASV